MGWPVADGSLFGRVRGPISIDLFAGGGGASEGIRQATGFGPVVAINHNPAAIAMHAANHPETEHYCESVFDVVPLVASRGRAIDLLWASPDCTHFSRAKGGQPRSQGIRGLAWVVVDWARDVRPRVIALENVPEFVTWGPLDSEGRPVKEQAGETFTAFVAALRSLGYVVEWRTLVAADYGTPTTRKRLFLVARRDGQPIRWPEPTHGAGRPKPWIAAAECIDWSLLIPSIFDRKKPLAEPTQRRIAEGVRRFVLDNPRPYLVNLTHGGRLEPLSDPMRTVTGAHRGEKALISPSLIQTGYGERKGQRPRVLNLHAPFGTLVGGQKHGLVAAFMARHFTGCPGRGLDQPVPTVTAIDHHAPVAVFLDKHYSSARAGQGVDRPMPTVTGQGGHASLVAAFLAKYYGSDKYGQGIGDPLHTIPTVDRFGLVTVTIDGAPWVLADIGMRMLQPRELARAQGFDDAYILTGTKSEQVARIGNSVCPPLARAIAAANLC